MTAPRLATYSVNGIAKYGLVTDRGIVDLSARFDYPTLREAIEAGALMKLAEEGARHSPDHGLTGISWLTPIPAPEKIICIGVNYPDRNAEYKDGSDAPKYPSMFLRTPRSFVGHNTPVVRPLASPQLDYEGELVIVIGKAGRHIPEAKALDHILTGHLPYPAIVVDRHGRVVAANTAFAVLTEGSDPALLGPDLNILRLALHPRGLAPRILTLPGLGLDVDSPDDLTAVLAERGATDTHRLVAAWRERLAANPCTPDR